MNKTWISREKGDDKLIGIANEVIYKVNPKMDEISDYAERIKQNKISQDILSIPFSYIKSIQHQEGKKYIQVFFGHESEEHLRIKDTTKRFEVFKHFKENIPSIAYEREEYSALKAGRKPLIALIILSLLFAWTLYLAIQISMGYDYEIVGNRDSIIGLVLGIAYLGIMKVILIFGSLITLGLWSMIRKMKNRPIVHALNMIRL